MTTQPYRTVLARVDPKRRVRFHAKISNKLIVGMEARLWIDIYHPVDTEAAIEDIDYRVVANGEWRAYPHAISLAPEMIRLLMSYGTTSWERGVFKLEIP